MNKDGSYEAKFIGGPADDHWERFDVYVEDVVRQGARYRFTGWSPMKDALQQVYAVYEPLRLILPPGVSP
jgi:hypothetical protein